MLFECWDDIRKLEELTNNWYKEFTKDRFSVATDNAEKSYISFLKELTEKTEPKKNYGTMLIGQEGK